MSLLKSEPAASVRTLEELFAIAFAMEEEAAARYGEIAARMRALGNTGLASIFDRLSEDERGHRDSVVQWSQREKGKPPDPALVVWDPPATFDDEGAGTTDPGLLTAYRTLSMAVRNEERAFAFWSYVAAQAPSPEIHGAAEAMAREELEHVATLRRQRRRAFHVERKAAADATREVETADLERALANRLDQLAGTAISTPADRLRALARDARLSADELTRQRDLSLSIRVPSNIMDNITTLSELLVDHYLDTAEHIKDEAALTQAHALASRAVSRLAWLRADLPEIT